MGADPQSKNLQKDVHPSEDEWLRTNRNVDTCEVQCRLLSLEYLYVTE